MARIEQTITLTAILEYETDNVSIWGRLRLA